jgi:predicted AAA+ superfamily ATPase
MIGGMPKIVFTFINEQNLSRVINLYASIITAYKSDIEKYAQNNTQREILRHIMDTAPFEIDNRIKLANFGGSNFKSREVKEAISALEKAKILELIYPTTNTSIPAYPDFKKSPRLSFLDVGLVNFQLGLHKELLNIKDLNDSSRGKLIHQIVMQELKSTSYLPTQKLNFWVRDEQGTSSEIDIAYPFKNYLIPIEIKSGASGTLRSLHEFMDRCNHPFAVRFYGGKISIDTLKTNKGKEYKLLNLPYFLAAWLDNYLEWFIAQ